MSARFTSCFFAFLLTSLVTSPPSIPAVEVPPSELIFFLSLFFSFLIFLLLPSLCYPVILAIKASSDSSKNTFSSDSSFYSFSSYVLAIYLSR